MPYRNIKTNRGLIRTIVLIVIALLVLSYFGFNIREIANSPTTRENFSYTTSFVVGVWNDYLKRPVTYIWKEIFIDLIWEPVTNNLGSREEPQEELQEGIGEQ